MLLNEFLHKLEGVKKQGGSYVACCPAHEDSKQSLSVSEGKDGILLFCHAGCSTENVVTNLGLRLADLFPEKEIPLSAGSQNWAEPEAVYDYRDEEGCVLFQALRFPGKKFRQRHHDPSNPEAREDGYVWKLDGVRRVLYRLPETLAAVKDGETVYITEGEKDVEALVAVGKAATCNPLGAGKWRDEYSDVLIGANVIIVQDRDEPGRKHAEKVKASLQGKARRIWVFQSRAGKDVSDHLAAGNRPEDLVEVRERVRRGVVTAHELAERARVHLNSREGDDHEHLVDHFGTPPLALRAGRTYAVGGYQGEGKTVLGLQLSRLLCEAGDIKVGIFSLEMSDDDLRNRFISQKGIPLWKVERPWLLSESEKTVYVQTVAEISSWPLEIIFNSRVTADEIVEITMDREYDFVVVDHISRLNWGGERRKLEAEINTLTNLGLEFNIPVMILAQLRKFERGAGFGKFPKPTLQDFRETSMIGDDSSVALAVWRTRMEDGVSFEPSGVSQLVVLKNRYGDPPAGHSYMLHFNQLTGTFDKGVGSVGQQPWSAMERAEREDHQVPVVAAGAGDGIPF